MQMLDANIILRYLLNDNKIMADEAEKIINEDSVYVTIEVIAEVVYVLNKVYSIKRDKIKMCLFEFLSEVNVSEEQVIKVGLEKYAEQNLDFVDCILFAYNRVKGYKIRTFDKKLEKLLQDTTESNNEEPI